MIKKFKDYIKESQEEDLSRDIKKQVANQYMNTFKTFILSKEEPFEKDNLEVFDDLEADLKREE